MQRDMMRECIPPKEGAEVIDPMIPEVGKFKKWLGYLCYGKVAYIFLVLLALHSAMAAFSELLTLWMIYLAYSRLHWCQTGFLLFIFVMAGLTTMSYMFEMPVMFVLFLYNVAGIYIAYNGATVFYSIQNIRGFRRF